VGTFFVLSMGNPKKRSKTSNRALHRLHSIRYDVNHFVVPALQRYVKEWQCQNDHMNDDDKSRHLANVNDKEDTASMPLIFCNERCGTWYWPHGVVENDMSMEALGFPHLHPHSCHFKSTDGHRGSWLFSLKRLNLHVIYDAIASNCCLILDSSVQKDMPDSFSRTIPLWAAVWNQAAVQCRKKLGMNETNEAWDSNREAWSKLRTPRWMVDEEEHATMESLVQVRVDELLQSGAIVDPHRLATTLRDKPLCPFWCSATASYDENQSWPSALDYQRCIPIICLNASQHNFDVSSTLSSTSRRTYLTSISRPFWYTPGAADDEESWSRGLTPAIFWKHLDRLLLPDTSHADVDGEEPRHMAGEILSAEDEMDTRIDTIVAEYKHVDDDIRTASSLLSAPSSSLFDWIGSTGMAIGSRRAGRPPGCWESFDAIVNVTDTEYPDMIPSSSSSSDRYYLQLPVQEGKRDRMELERWMAVGVWFCLVHAQQGRRILIHCAQGKDRSVCLALAVVVLFCNLKFPLQWKAEMRTLQSDTLLSCCEESSNDANDREMYLSSGIPSKVVGALLGRPGRDLLLRILHNHENRVTAHGETSTDVTDLANKETLRIGLHLIRQYREKAEPTRSNMQKINRFFMSSKYDSQGSK